MSISIAKKRAAVIKTFGIPIDPEETGVIDFLYARRHCATVPERGGRELQYLVELDNLEHLIVMTLDRVRKRDGAKIFKEAATYLCEAIEIASERRARCKANGAHV